MWKLIPLRDKQTVLTNVNAGKFKGLTSFCSYKANPWKLRYFSGFFSFHSWMTKQQFTCSEIQHVMMTLHSESGGPVFIYSSLTFCVMLYLVYRLSPM